MVTGKWFWWCPKHSSHMERSTNGMQCSGLRHWNLGKLVPLQMKHFFPYSNGVNEEIKLCLEPLPAVGKTERAGDAALPGQEERGSGGWSRGCAHQGAVMGMNRRLVEGKCQ